jgi:hypothetical protein
MQYYAMQSDAMQSDAMQGDAMQGDAMQCGAVQLRSIALTTASHLLCRWSSLADGWVWIGLDFAQAEADRVTSNVFQRWKVRRHAVLRVPEKCCDARPSVPASNALSTTVIEHCGPL